jgi:F-type H+-transporting ATPase subunit b
MEALGIDLFLIVVQIINFALLLYVLKRVLYRPILDALKKRQERILQITQDRQSLDEEKEKFEKERVKILEKAQAEKSKIIAEGRKQAEEERRVLLEKTNLSAKAILEKTKDVAQRDIQKQENIINERALEIAAVMARKALEQSMDQKDRENTVSKAIKELEKLEL